MEFIANNKTYTDCFIVAIHNAIGVVGHKPVSYESIKRHAHDKGWYIEGFGFYNAYLENVFKRYRIKCTPIKKIVLKNIFDRVVSGKHVLIVTAPKGGGTGHAMVATKGEVGVKVLNSLISYSGWRTLCKEYRKNWFTMSAFEIEAFDDVI